MLLLLGDFEQIKSIFIYLNKYRYPFLKLANAFGTMFKMFIVFDLEYSDESEVLYMFFQIYFYDISSKKNHEYIKYCT